MVSVVFWTLDVIIKLTHTVLVSIRTYSKFEIKREKGIWFRRR